jgi:hypothetical protein
MIVPPKKQRLPLQLHQLADLAMEVSQKYGKQTPRLQEM